MSKETCTLCDAETGRAGIYEDSMYPVLAGDFFRSKKGDNVGPVCEECYSALDQLDLIDHEG